MIEQILFDLDGTLLPMDQDIFTEAYFKRLAKKLAPRGYDTRELIDGIWAGTAAMVKNDGSRTNEEAFWERFSELLGERVFRDKPLFDEYYRVEFQQVAPVCGFTPQAKETVEELKRLGYRLALATNPIFPAVATESRIRWAGLDPGDFELYTTYENTGYCKPNPEYYRDLQRKLGCPAERCLMVGNDVEEDMVAESVGMRVFLLNGCVINREGRDTSRFAQGGFEELRRYLEMERRKGEAYV